MHIVFMTYQMYPEYTAGMQLGTHFIATELVKLGHKATVIVTRRERTTSFFRKQGENHHYYSVYRLGYINLPYLRFISELFNTFIFTLSFLNKMKLKKEEVVLYAQCLSPAGILVSLLGRIFRHPSIIYLYGRDIGLSNFLFRKVVSKWVLTNINLILTATHWAKKKTLEAVPKLKNVKVFYSGFDWSNFMHKPENTYKIREELKITSDEFVILFTGRLIPDKSVDILIEAFKKVKDKFPQTKLIIIGKGREEVKLKELVKRLNLDGEVIFLGYVDNRFLARYFYASDLLVLPSRVEPFGVVLLEAMACGLPVIGTNTMGIPEIIENGVNGFLFEKNDVEGLYNAIIKLINDKELYSKISRNNVEKAKKFSWSERIKELEEELKGISICYTQTRSKSYDVKQ